MAGGRARRLHAGEGVKAAYVRTAPALEGRLDKGLSRPYHGMSARFPPWQGIFKVYFCCFLRKTSAGAVFQLVTFDPCAATRS
jgi:hypothetical protein